VLCEPSSGIVAVVRDGSEGYVRLVVVAPDLRRIGRGRELLQAAEEWLAGVDRVTLCADPHYALWPGIVATDLALVCLAESAGYRQSRTSVTMEFDLKSPLPPDPGGWEVAEVEHDHAVERLCAAVAPSASHSVLRALERGTLVVVPDGQEVAAACAFDVNRAGVVGPVVVRAGGPDLTSRYSSTPPGVSTATENAHRVALLGALRKMREWRHPRAELSDVDALRPYIELGGKVSRVSFVYTKSLRDA
jgi:GNAT superfamily N-acetyltransferase